MPQQIRFHQFGGSTELRLEDVTLPAPKGREVLVDVRAVAVNWGDILRRQNLSGEHVELPAGLGYEISGVVRALGPEVRDLTVGQRVASIPAHDLNLYPGYGEQALLPREALLVVHDSLSDEQAAGFYGPLISMYLALTDLARAKPGQRVLVTAASQCHGPAAVQMAKALGLHVMAASQFAEDAQWLQSLGADKVINCAEQDLLLESERFTGGLGLDIALDGQCSTNLCLLAEALGTSGKLVLYGYNGGNEAVYPACVSFQKHLQILRHCLMDYSGCPELNIAAQPELLEQAYQRVQQLLDNGQLQATVAARFSLSQAAAAHDLMETCPRGGRVVLSVEAQHA